MGAYHHADVRNGCAFGHRWYGANIQNNARNRCSRFEDYVANVVRDVTNLHSLLYIRSTLDERIKDPRLFACECCDLFDPDRMLDDSRCTINHLQITHYVYTAID